MILSQLVLLEQYKMDVSSSDLLSFHNNAIQGSKWERHDYMLCIPIKGAGTIRPLN